MLSPYLWLSQYREWTVGSLSSAMWCSMFMQFTGHAQTPQFQLSCPTAHSLCCDVITTVLLLCTCIELGSGCVFILESSRPVV